MDFLDVTFAGSVYIRSFLYKSVYEAHVYKSTEGLILYTEEDSNENITAKTISVFFKLFFLGSMTYSKVCVMNCVFAVCLHYVCVNVCTFSCVRVSSRLRSLCLQL